MKNKRIIFIFMFILAAAILFVNPEKVKASDSISTGSDSYNQFEVTTKIERWTPVNDLVYVKEDDWSTSWYTKTVFLRGTLRSTGSEAEVEISSSDFEYNSSVGGYAVELGTSDPSSSYDFDFEYGSTVYLVEKYDISNITNEGHTFVVNDIDTSYSIPTNDYLDFTFNDSTVESSSKYDYDPSSSQQVYIEARFQSSTPSEEYRDKYLYPYLKDSNDSKTYTVSQGTINLPIFCVYVDFSASGNMMPAGYFRIPDLPSVYWGSNNANISSGYGYANGYVIRNDEYSLLRYNDVDYSSRTVEYVWNEYDVVATSGSSSSISKMVDVSRSSRSRSVTENIYDYRLSTTINEDSSAPNGVFYNILPYAVAGIIAVAGIVLLKKHSVK